MCPWSACCVVQAVRRGCVWYYWTNWLGREFVCSTLLIKPITETVCPVTGCLQSFRSFLIYNAFSQLVAQECPIATSTSVVLRRKAHFIYETLQQWNMVERCSPCVKRKHHLASTPNQNLTLKSRIPECAIPTTSFHLSLKCFIPFRKHNTYCYMFRDKWKLRISDFLRFVT